MDVSRYLPIFVSILIIIAIGILRDYSRTFAAIAAVAPINIPLGMWIIYAGAEDKQQAMVDYNSALFLNIIPTLLFMIVAWGAARAGWGLVPIIAIGYATWALGMGVLFALRQFLTAS